jgi:ubiquinone/menaquinone biosynthesis C-methylase UbiE
MPAHAARSVTGTTGVSWIFLPRNLTIVPGKNTRPKHDEEREIAMIPGPTAWEEDYARRGRLWGGAIPALPDLPEGSRILELGCGNGKAVMAMIQRCWDVTAIDFSPTAVTLCRQVIPDLLQSPVMVADARWSPFKNAAFDAVFATHILGHMPAPDRRSIAGEIIRVLSPGGMVFFCEFSTSDFRFGKGYETEEATFRRGNDIITHYFSEEEVHDLFSPLAPVSMNTHQWPMRVRGRNLVRSEITAVFTRKQEFIYGQETGLFSET